MLTSIMYVKVIVMRAVPQVQQSLQMKLSIGPHASNVTMPDYLLKKRLKNIPLGLILGIRRAFRRKPLDILSSRWVRAMEWSGQKEFSTSPEVSCAVDGLKVGLLKTEGWEGISACGIAPTPQNVRRKLLFTTQSFLSD
ncbi:Serine carboxypeptidase [Spatholobus suberectus]|nr:Serine carboxypeptidase [Spatholobus suberectus]